MDGKSATHEMREYIPMRYEFPVHVEVHEHLNQQLRLIKPCHNLLQHSHLEGWSNFKRRGLCTRRITICYMEKW